MTRRLQALAAVATLLAGSASASFSAAGSLAESLSDASAGLSVDDAPAGDSPHGLSPLQQKRMAAVVSALEQIAKSVDEDAAVEQKNFDCFQKWCSTEQEAKTTELEDAQEAIKEGKVARAAADLGKQQANFAVAAAKQELAGTQTTLAQSAATRAEEKKAYEAELALARQAQRQLERAIKIVAKQGDSSPAERAALLQRYRMGADQQEAAFVLGVFRQLLSTQRETEKKIEAAEATRRTDYTTMERAKKAQAAGLQRRIEELTAELTSHGTAGVGARAQVREQTKAATNAASYLGDVKRDCAKETEAFEARSVDRAKQRAALREAISYLLISTRSFASPAAAAVPSLFVQLQLAGGAVDFSLVRKAISGLIRTLLDERNREDGKFKRCIRDMKLAGVDLNGAGEAEARNEANIELYSTEVQQTTDKIDALKELFARSKLPDAEIDDARAAAATQFAKATKDRALASKVLGQARDVLAKFFASESASLVQASAPTSGPRPAVAVDSPVRRAQESNVVVAMLEKLADDLRREQTAAARAEASAVAEHKAAVSDRRSEFDDRMVTMTEAAKARARLSVRLARARDDRDSIEAKLEGAKQRAASLAQNCRTQQNYDSFCQANNFSVSQLRDANDILAGSRLDVNRLALFSAQSAASAAVSAPAAAEALTEINRAIGRLG